MIPKIIAAVYSSGSWIIKGKLWQYDYGRVLRIQGLSLPTAVEIQLSLESTGSNAISRIGLTADGTTDVVIPDSLLENDDTDQSYYIYAFIYITDDDSGSTVHMIQLHVTARAKPEATLSTDETALWADVKDLIAEYIEEAATSAENAATSEENAKASEEAAAVSAAAAKTSESNAATSEENAKASEEAAAASAAAAKASESNAVTSEENAKASEEAAATSAAAAKTSETNAATSEANAKAAAEAAATDLLSALGLCIVGGAINQIYELEDE